VGWQGPVALVVVAMSIGIIVPTALLMLIVIWALDAFTLLNWLIFCAVMGIALAGAGLLVRHYRPMWWDMYTSYQGSLRRVTHYTEDSLEEAGMEYEKRTREEDPTLKFNALFHVRSEGFRVGLMKHSEYITVYAGPMKDFNEKSIRWFMHHIDKHLWRPPDAPYVPDVEDLRSWK
jgi:hypothetical protein